MRAKNFSDLLKAGDRVAVSNITGREASTVTVTSQKYCQNIVGGWALGKGNQNLEMPGHEPIPVFPNVQELSERLDKEKVTDEVVGYSLHEAVYGEVEEVTEHWKKTV